MKWISAAPDHWTMEFHSYVLSVRKGTSCIVSKDGTTITRKKGHIPSCTNTDRHNFSIQGSPCDTVDQAQHAAILLLLRLIETEHSSLEQKYKELFEWMKEYAFHHLESSS